MKEEKTYTEKQVKELLEKQKEACAKDIRGLMSEYTARKIVRETELVLPKKEK